jgi:hypothetical protein
MIFRKTVVMALGLFLGACASTGDEHSMPAAAATVCEDPRPQMCTMDYRPVCGTLNDGSSKTYANSCGACADAAVTSWVENACPE